MKKEEVINKIKAENLILSVDITDIEHISDESTKELNCILYEDFGYFVPKEHSRIVLQEKEVNYILNELHKEDKIYMSSDVFFTDKFIRYFAIKKPKEVVWKSSKKKHI